MAKPEVEVQAPPAAGTAASPSQIVPASAAGETGVATIGPDALALWAKMAETVPEIGEDAWGSIIAQIASAESIEDLDKPWKTEGMKDLNGVPLQIRGIKRAPSDFEGGLSSYLIVDCIRLDTGESLVTTTGSTAIVVQLVRAHGIGAFPLNVIPRVAVKETRSGFRPMHLEVPKVQPKR